MPKPRMATTPAATVHLLHNRLAACGTLRGEPPDWPAGHLWVKPERGFMVNCTPCRRILQEITAAKGSVPHVGPQ